MPPVIDYEICEGCGVCEDSCPLDIIYFDEQSGRPDVRYKDECWHCGSCRQECPEEAISIHFPLRVLVPAGVIPY
jgi:adenylylsulfate reductase, subunit B